MNKLTALLTIIFATSSILISCKKNSVDEQYIEIVKPVIPDFTTKINAGVSGFITDENGNAAAGASIKGGTVTVVADKFGYFKISSAAFAKSAGFVQVSKGGYFTGYRTFVPIEGKETFIRLQLISKINTGNIDAAAGGTVTTTDGAKIILPANAVVTAANNSAYTGAINVAAHWLNPAEEQKTQLTMPGDLTGVDSAGHLNVLVTYGMLAVELTGSAGELLQIATGKKASLHFPIPSSVAGTAPSSIPLWYFDESKGVWKQEGRALKNGNNYEGDVSHFSFWNCDVGFPLVNFSVQLLDQNLNPIVNALVFILPETQNIGGRYEYTNSEGFVKGQIIANINLVMKLEEVCNQNIFIKNITTTNSDLDLGSIKVTLPLNISTFKGQVNKCNGSPLINGYIIITGADYLNAITINNGQFSSTRIICPDQAIQFFAIDADASQQSSPQNIIPISGINDLGTLTACDPIESEFITYTIDGATTSLTLPQYLFGGRFDFTQDSTTIDAVNLLNPGTGNEVWFRFGGPTTAGSYALANNFFRTSLSGGYQFTTPVNAVITTYGLIGNFITGSFSGTAIIPPDMVTTHTVRCTFNIKRDQ